MLLNNIIESLGDISFVAMSAGAAGNIAVLCKDHIFITCSDSSSKLKMKRLALSKPGSSDDYLLPVNRYTDISYNADDSMLVIYGNNHIAVIDISNATNKIVACNDNSDITDVPIFTIDHNNCSCLSDKVNVKSSAILKLSWHPLFTGEIIVLLEGNFLLSVHSLVLFGGNGNNAAAYDVFPLDTVEPIVSYAYGKQSSMNVDSCWSGLSLYLIGGSPITSSKNGHVYALCPFVPINNNRESTIIGLDSYVDTKICREWINDYMRSQKAQSHSAANMHLVERYADDLVRYLDSVSGNSVLNNNKHRYCPVLQGPFILDSSYIPPQKPHHHNKANIDVVSCDLIILNTPVAGNSVDASEDAHIPLMLMISYSNGNNNVYILSSECFPLVGLVHGLPGQLQVQSLSVGDANDESDSDEEIVLCINRAESKIKSGSQGNRASGLNEIGSSLANDKISKLLPQIELIYFDSLNTLDHLVFANCNAGTGANDTPSAELAGGFCFTMDPVLPHCVYSTLRKPILNGATSGVFVYMICLSWWYELFKLKTPSMLLENAAQSNTIADSNRGVSGACVRVEELMKNKPMYCLPIFSQLICSPQRVVTSRSTINCMTLISSPLLGHKILIKCDGNKDDKDTGLMMCVNVTMHMKLCELHSQLAASRALMKHPSFAISGQKQQMAAYNEIIQSKLHDIRKILIEIPTPSRRGLKTSESVSTCSKFLSESTLFIEENVLIPLEELYQRLNYRMEIIKQIYSKQVEMLQGPSVKCDENAMMELLNKPNKSKEDFQVLNGLGIQKLIDLIRKRQETLQVRVDSVNEAFGIQKELVEQSIVQSLYIHNKHINPKEKEFQEQLHKWRRQAVYLENCVANLESQKATQLEPVVAKARSESSGNSENSMIAGTATPASVKSSPMHNPRSPMSMYQQSPVTPRTDDKSSYYAASPMNISTISSGVNTTSANAWYTRTRSSRSNTPRGGSGTTSKMGLLTPGMRNKMLQSSAFGSSNANTTMLPSPRVQQSPARTSGAPFSMQNAITNAIYGGSRGAGSGVKAPPPPLASLTNHRESRVHSVPPSSKGLFMSPAMENKHKSSVNGEVVKMAPLTNDRIGADTESVNDTHSAPSGILFNSPPPLPSFSQNKVSGSPVATFRSTGSKDNAAPSDSFTVRETEYIKELLVQQSKDMKECQMKLRALERGCSLNR